MDYGSSRRKTLKAKLGILLFMPSFAIGVGSTREARIAEVVEEFIATAFIRHLKRTLRVTARKEVATDLLRSLMSFMERSHQSRSSETSSDPKLVEHWKRFEQCKKLLLETIVKDFEDIFQVKLDDEGNYDQMQREGNRLLRQVWVSTRRGSVFKLMPCGTAAALLCDMAISGRCLSSSETVGSVSEAQKLLEEILRVWLCCLDSAAFAIQEDVDIEKEAVPDVQLENWQSYLVTSKTIFDWLAKYHNFYPLFECKERSMAASTVLPLNFSNEDEMSFHSNIVSVHSLASSILAEIYRTPRNDVSLRTKLHQEILMDISQEVDAIRTVDERGDKSGMVEVSASCHAFSRKGIAIARTWPTNMTTGHEDLIRGGLLQRNHVYEITVHALVGICSALFTESRYMEDVYGPLVEEFISSSFVELLTK